MYTFYTPCKTDVRTLLKTLLKIQKKNHLHVIKHIQI